MDFAFINCFLLLILILVWNFIFTKKLPGLHKREIFWNDIPKTIALPENFFRLIVIINPLFLPLTLNTEIKWIGFWIYLFGMLIYIISWLPLLLKPDSNWNRNYFGFNAPAFLPITWLLGISLISANSDEVINIFYFGSSVAFVFFHVIHSTIVLFRNK